MPSPVRKPQLDALRSFAVGVVMLHHFWPGVADPVPLASVGVRLFFVLSGFLITGILLDAKRGGLPLSTNLRNFYARRTVRIFPLFYLTLAVTYVLNVPPVRETIGWHATYLSNVYFFLRGDWHGSVSHFWSLAVEEQFYLAWPALVLLLPERWLGRAVLCAILVGPLSRLLIVSVLGHPLGVVLPVCCLDTLGLGALLALRGGRPERWWLPAGLAIFGGCQVLRFVSVGEWLVVTFEDAGLALACGWLVAKAAAGFEGWAGRVLTLRPLLYLGTISYGLYTFHNFVPWLLRDVLEDFNVPYGNRPARFLLLAGVTVGIASLSWFLFERPINRLKRYFEYAPRAAARAPEQTQVIVGPSLPPG